MKIAGGKADLVSTRTTSARHGIATRLRLALDAGACKLDGSLGSLGGVARSRRVRPAMRCLRIWPVRRAR